MRHTLPLLVLLALAAWAVACGAPNLTILEQNLLRPPFTDVAEQDSGLGPSLLGYHVNYGGLTLNTPTHSNPFYWREVKIFDALPAVNHTIDSRYPPKILWGWGEQHIDFLHTDDPCAPTMDDGCGGCCGAWYTETQVHEVHLENVVATVQGPVRTPEWVLLFKSIFPWITDRDLSNKTIYLNPDPLTSNDNPFDSQFSSEDLNISTWYINQNVSACNSTINETDQGIFNCSGQTAAECPSCCQCPGCANCIPCADCIDANITKALPLNITVTITGEWVVHKTTTVNHPHYRWFTSCPSDGGECTRSCDCDTTPTFEGERRIPFSVNITTFPLHSGNVSQVLLDPSVDIYHNVSRVMFEVSARRNFTKYYPIVNGKMLDAVYFQTFYRAKDPYGVQYVLLNETNSTGLILGDPDAPDWLPKNDTPHTLQWWLLEKEAFIWPAQEAGAVDNYTVAATFAVYFSPGSEMSWNDTPGYVLFDWFGNSYSGEFKLNHSKTTGFSEFTVVEEGGQAVLKMRLIDEDGLPVPNAAASVTAGNATGTVLLNQDGTGEFRFAIVPVGTIPVSASFLGLPGYKPTYSSKTYGNLPFTNVTSSTSFSKLTSQPDCLIIAILGVFAGLAYVTTGHVFGMRFIMSIVDALGGMAIAHKLGMGKIVGTPAAMGRSVGRGVSKMINAPANAVQGMLQKGLVGIVTGGAGAAAAGGAAGAAGGAAAKGGIAGAAGKTGGPGALGKEAAGKAAMGKKLAADAVRRNKLGMAANRAKGMVPGGVVKKPQLVSKKGTPTSYSFADKNERLKFNRMYEVNETKARLRGDPDVLVPRAQDKFVEIYGERFPWLKQKTIAWKGEIFANFDKTYSAMFNEPGTWRCAGIGGEGIGVVLRSELRQKVMAEFAAHEVLHNLGHLNGTTVGSPLNESCTQYLNEINHAKVCGPWPRAIKPYPEGGGPYDIQSYPTKHFYEMEGIFGRQPIENEFFTPSTMPRDSSFLSEKMDKLLDNGTYDNWISRGRVSTEHARQFFWKEMQIKGYATKDNMVDIKKVNAVLGGT